MTTHLFKNKLILTSLVIVSIIVLSCSQENSPTPTIVSTFAVQQDYNQIGYNITIDNSNTIYFNSRSIIGQVSDAGEILYFTGGSYYPNWQDVNEIYAYPQSIAFNKQGERIGVYEALVIYPNDDVAIRRGFIAKGQPPYLDFGYKSPEGSYSGFGIEIIAVDANNVLYGVVNGWYDGIYGGAIFIIENDEVIFLAGNGPGYVDGDSEISRFRRITDIELDNDNNLIIADPDNHCIRKVTPQGVVSTIAGINSPGLQNGTLENALFNRPSGIAINKSGDIYVADSGNHCIRKISKNGNVTTVVGSGIAGYQDGIPTEAKFQNPTDVAIGPKGELYILDSGNKSIRLLK